MNGAPFTQAVAAERLRIGSPRSRISVELNNAISTEVRRRMVATGFNWTDIASAIGVDHSLLRRGLQSEGRRISVGTAAKVAAWLEPGAAEEAPDTLADFLSTASDTEAEDIVPVIF